MARWTPRLPERWGDTNPAYGFLFSCTRCGRHQATKRDAALAAWGEQGRIADTLARVRCRYCRRRGVMRVEYAPLKAGLGSKRGIDRLVEEIRAVKPVRQVE